MIRFCLLGSGSSGNATLVASNGVKILIDAGLSFKQMQLRAAAVGETLDDLQGVFITHEHGDHVSGLGTLARKLNVPVFLTPQTRDALSPAIGKLPRVELFEAGEEVRFDGLRVGSFSVPHDAADPVCYAVSSDRAKLGLAADLGKSSDLVRERLSGSQGLILESNYCPDMLRRGPYPAMVQQRIRGRHGHLSNADMCALLNDIAHDTLKVVVLVHISDDNNTHELAHSMASRVVGGRNTEVHVARRDQPTPMFTIGV